MLQPWTSNIAAWKGISATSGNTTTSSRRSSDGIDCDSGSNSGDGPFKGRSDACLVRSRLQGNSILMTPGREETTTIRRGRGERGRRRLRDH